MEIKVALKYCGSCNPYFDLIETGRSLVESIARLPGFTVVPLSSDDIDVVVVLCGCPRACVNKDEVRSRGKYCIFINDDSHGNITNIVARLRATATG